MYVREREEVYLNNDGSVEVIPEERKVKRKKQPLVGESELTVEVQPAPVKDGEASESQPVGEEQDESAPDGGSFIGNVNEVGPDREASEAEVLNGEVVDVQPPDTEEPEEVQPEGGRQILGTHIQISGSSKANAATELNGEVIQGVEEGLVVHPPVREAAAYRAHAYISTYRGPEGAMPGYSDHFLVS